AAADATAVVAATQGRITWGIMAPSTMLPARTAATASAVTSLGSRGRRHRDPGSGSALAAGSPLVSVVNTANIDASRGSLASSAPSISASLYRKRPRLRRFRRHQGLGRPRKVISTPFYGGLSSFAEVTGGSSRTLRYVERPPGGGGRSTAVISSPGVSAVS